MNVTITKEELYNIYLCGLTHNKESNISYNDMFERNFEFLKEFRKNKSEEKIIEEYNQLNNTLINRIRI